jgi:hypothetical protein
MDLAEATCRREIRQYDFKGMGGLRNSNQYQDLGLSFQ